jgi:hypothetical protein
VKVEVGARCRCPHHLPQALDDVGHRPPARLGRLSTGVERCIGKIIAQETMEEIPVGLLPREQVGIELEDQDFSLRQRVAAA